MDELLEYLKELAALGAPVCIYDDSEDLSVFSYGLIMGVSREYIECYNISPDGRFDGVSVRTLSEIAGLNLDAPFSMKYIDKMHKITPAAEYRRFKFEIDPNRPSESVLDIAKTLHRAVAVRLRGEETAFTGFVSGLEADRAVVRCVDEFGYEKVEEDFKISDIAEIECMSIELGIIEKLWAVNYGRLA